MRSSQRIFGRHIQSTPEARDQDNAEAEAEALPVVVEVTSPRPIPRFDSPRSHEGEASSQAVEFRLVEQHLRQRLKKRHERLEVFWQRLILVPPILLGAFAIFQGGPLPSAFEWLLYALIALSIGISITWGRWKPKA